MNQPTNRDVRNAVILAVLVTAVVMLALFDPSCSHRGYTPSHWPTRSIAP